MSSFSVVNSGAVSEQKVQAALVEIEMITDVFNRIVSSCHAKCIQPDPMKGRYAEPELLKGEAVCVDRCTMKFFEVNDKVSQRMQAMGGQAQMAGSFGR
ncbi:protein transporter [Trichosporon asahii var. asahii CBS 8904]|uniref:Mitochondrial import inner membrane translocase subunit n=1 Tax=Trichosporon asahii var. asahii (strain CBS 8904) TaxID=1220162 RepID=K1V2K0_TRIAC|nr:protein transporter [Trichosporon asahii var. asahii CBS 8904]